jgi:hypothetical protein
MDNDIAILNPVTELTVAGQLVTVRELRWAEALEFLQKLGAHAGQAITIGADGRIETALTAERLTGIVTGAGELCDYLVVKSTGRDAGWFHALSASDALAVLDAALALNLSDEIIGRAKKLLARFAGGPGATTEVSARSTIS